MRRDAVWPAGAALSDSGDQPVLLVLYHSRGTAQLPFRTAIEDHLLCWGRHSVHPVIYHNYAFGFDWGWFKDLPIAAIILDTLALNLRWDPEFFIRRTRPLLALRDFRGPKIAMPQDEFIHTDVLCDFLGEIGTTHVFSAGDLSTARQIYAALPSVQLEQALTGYIEPATLKAIDDAAARRPSRMIDLGYRAWRAEPWLGEHGHLKAVIADRVLALAPQFPQLRIDVSTREQDTLVGDAWLTFLLSCRAVLGVEGGASVHDPTGSIKQKTNRFVQDHPDADFETIRQACFAAEDGAFRLFAIGPRHLEASATRTPQIMVEGDYQGVLRSGLDYIALRRDLSDLPEKLDMIARCDPSLSRVAESAYARVVASGNYTYERFVRRVEAMLATEIAPRSRLERLLAKVGLDTRRGRVERAIARHEAIAAFALHEALDLLPKRSYATEDKATAKRWRAVWKAQAQRCGARRIMLDPHW